MQIDLDKALNSRSITFTIAGKPYEFKGSLRQEKDATQYWRGEGSNNNTMYIFRQQDGSFHGGIVVGFRSYKLAGKGRDGLLVEVYSQLFNFSHTPPASSAASTPKN